MRSFSIRQLNPFSGVLQVFETDTARAFSANGVVWRLQVLGERPQHTWRSAGQQTMKQYFNWALWSAAEGLQQVSANPLLDIGAMQRVADKLVEELQQQLGQLPFEPADRFEYWACDYHGRPIALIASTCDIDFASGSPDAAWHATAMADHGFESETLQAAGTPNNDGHCPRAHAEYLESEVRHRAQARHWFERRPDGSGQRLDNTQAAAAADFPPFGIETAWDEPLTLQLVKDYIRWLSPLLLLLPIEDGGERSLLEQQARSRAELVSDLYRLYPQITQPELIEQARVEARLRRAGSC